MHYFKYLKWDTVQQLEDSISLCSVLYKHRINTSRHLCLGDYKAGNWRYFIVPVKPKLAVMLNSKGKICHLCHSNCTCMLISCMLLTWPCTWRKESPYVVTKAVSPSTILGAGWILRLSDLWDSAQSFLAKTGEGWAQRRLFSVDLAMMVK